MRKARDSETDRAQGQEPSYAENARAKTKRAPSRYAELVGPEETAEAAAAARSLPGTDVDARLGPPPPALALAVQMSSGNMAVGRMIQRDWRDFIPSLPGLGEEKSKPVEKNWDVPATGAEDLTPGWNEMPAFPSGYSAHEATPELDAGKVAFQRDWTTLAQSWNRCAQIAERTNIKAKLPEAYVEKIDGQDVPPPPKQLVPGAESARPSGKQDFPVGSIFGPDNKLDMKTPFDPNRLTGTDRAEYDKKIADTTETRNATEKQRVTVEQQLVGVKNAFSKLRQAKIKEKQAAMGTEQKEAAKQKEMVVTERAEFEAVLKGVEKILGAAEKKDVAGAVLAGAEMAGTLYYEDKLGQISERIAELDTAIARLQESYELEEVVQAKNAIVTAQGEVRKALPDLNTAVTKEKAAFNDLALTIEKLAKKLGMDPESVRIARTAAAALPLIEETLGNLVQLDAAAVIPSYGAESGIGAGLVTNLATFQQHLATLKGFRTQVSLAKVQWTQRRTAAQQGVGVPAQTTL